MNTASSILPEDILWQIFELVHVPQTYVKAARNPIEVPLEKSDLHACARVCKAWLGPARRLLYRRPAFSRMGDESKFLASIRSNEGLAYLVHHLNLSMQGNHPQGSAVARAVEGIFYTCPSLQKVLIKDITDSDAPRVLDALARSKSRTSLTQLLVFPVLGSSFSANHVAKHSDQWPNLNSLTLYNSKPTVSESWSLARTPALISSIFHNLPNTFLPSWGAAPSTALDELKIGYSTINDSDLRHYVDQSGSTIRRLTLEKVRGLSQEGLLESCKELGRHGRLDYLCLKMHHQWTTPANDPKTQRDTPAPSFFYDLVQVLPSLETLHLDLFTSDNSFKSSSIQSDRVPTSTVLDVLPANLRNLVFNVGNMPFSFEEWRDFFKKTVPERYPNLESVVIFAEGKGWEEDRKSMLVKLAGRAGVRVEIGTNFLSCRGLAEINDHSRKASVTSGAKKFEVSAKSS